MTALRKTVEFCQDQFERSLNMSMNATGAVTPWMKVRLSDMENAARDMSVTLSRSIPNRATVLETKLTEEDVFAPS